MKIYSYVGPREIEERAPSIPAGVRISTVKDLLSWLSLGHEWAAFVVNTDGQLFLAPRRSEHVSCAGRGRVLSAGEMCFNTKTGELLEVSNQSTGYCPEPESWPAVERALNAIGVEHPGRFDPAYIFRLCSCGQRNIVKDDNYECAVCGSELPKNWNFEAKPA